MHISAIEITSKIVRGNNVDFSTIKIASQRVRGNNVDFSSKLHRNYIEKSTWKLHGFFDQQNYVEKSTLKRRGFFDHRNYMEKVRRNDVEIGRILVFDVST